MIKEKNPKKSPTVQDNDKTMKTYRRNNNIKDWLQLIVSFCLLKRLEKNDQKGLISILSVTNMMVINATRRGKTTKCIERLDCKTGWIFLSRHNDLLHLYRDIGKRLNHNETNNLSCWFYSIRSQVTSKGINMAKWVMFGLRSDFT